MGARPSSSCWDQVRGRGASSPRLRLFLWGAILGLIFGAIEFGEPLEHALRSARNVVQRHHASGEIVVVAIDDRSIVELDKWPWPRRYHAQIADNLHAMGARRIIFDIDFAVSSNPVDDRLLEESFARLGKKVILPVQFITDRTGAKSELYPMPELRRHAELANVNVRYDYRGRVHKLPYSVAMGGKQYQSFSALMANRSELPGVEFLIDYSIDRRSVPTVSASDVFNRKTHPGMFFGKDVIIGTSSRQLGDNFVHPSGSPIPGVYLHVLGAETLKAGTPVELGWIPLFVLAVALGGWSLRIRDVRFSTAVSGAGVLTIVGIPFASEPYLLFVDVMPALFFLILVGGVDASRKLKHAFRLRGKTNAISGLPNLEALREARLEQPRALVAARIQNYAEVTSALPAEAEKALVDQVSLRLTLGASATKLFQGDEGIFAWFCEAASLADHLDALHALFRSPVVIGQSPLDLTITFGVDADTSRSLTNRLGSALVAADEAAAEGLRWKEYDPAKLKDAAWKLSLLSQLDGAIDSGDLWVAYQPKLDLATDRIVGAEALVRWTHPEKGPISPIEFILAAEQSDRIERLTRFVLDRAIAEAATLNARGIDFGISVNLSARLVHDPALPEMVKALLEKHRLDPDRLTLEVTETVALTGSGVGIETLHQLRRIGVQLSIDDYGTGLSTLDYLKKIPASEIKIDKSFIQSVGNSRADMLMVHSTIQLAHSLGQKVVAEGVEEPETLELLRKIGCDLAQGFLIGRPVSSRALSRQVLAQPKRAAA